MDEYQRLLRRLMQAENHAANLSLPWPLLESAYWALEDAKQAVREFEAHADRHAGSSLGKEAG